MTSIATFISPGVIWEAAENGIVGCEKHKETGLRGEGDGGWLASVRTRIRPSVTLLSSLSVSDISRMW